jgi:hypothetical protein
MPITQWLPHDINMVTQVLIRIMSRLYGNEEEKGKREYVRAFSVKRWSSCVFTESRKFSADNLPALQADKQPFVWV